MIISRFAAGVALFGVFQVSMAEARMRGENGSLSLLVAVPLTRDNETALDPGFFHLAAARLAIDHFNERNTSVIPDLDLIISANSCDMRFDEVQAVDTGTDTHLALETVALQLPVAPDAIAGPYNEIPAVELSVFGTAFQTPVVAHRSGFLDLQLTKQHPYFNTVGAGVDADMEFVAFYLEQVANRTDYIAILHNSNTAVVQKVEILKRILRARSSANDKRVFNQVKTFSYHGKDYENGDTGESLESTLNDLKETGFRTIAWFPHLFLDEVPLLGETLSKVGLDKDRLWVVGEGADPRDALETYDFYENALVTQKAHFLNGSAYLFAFDGYTIHPTLDFRSHLFSQSTEFYESVLNFMPEKVQMEPPVMNESFPILKIAQRLRGWAPGAAFMYDAVMAIGIGACIAKEREAGTIGILGKGHLEGIRSVEFAGASGPIRFGGANTSFPGSRVGDTVPFTATNIVALNGSSSLSGRILGSLDPFTGEWVDGVSMVFPSGNSSSLELLRDVPEQNFIHPAARAFGLALFGIATVVVLLASCWVVANRTNAVVVAAQPNFLYALCSSSAIICPCMLLSAFDESWGFSNDVLDASCLSWVWLDAIGRMTTYGAIFTKLWRANRCLRYKTNKIAAWRIFWPCILLVVVVVSLLSVWTSASEFGWVRQEIDSVTGESIGLCTGGNSDIYFAPIYFFEFLTIVLALIMAWKTVGIDDLYSDSKWVLAFILVQIQVLLVSAPVIYILNDSNSTGRYVGLSLLTWTFPVSSMGLILLPKVLHVRRSRRLGGQNTAVSGRSSSSAMATGEDNAICPAVAPHGPRIQMVTFE